MANTKAKAMGIGKALAAKDMDGLTATVEAAVDTYPAAMPAEPTIETAHGAMNLRAVAAIDEDAKWTQVAVQYAEISRVAKNFPKETRNQDVAKLIATNAVLRNITVEAVQADGDFL